MSDVHDDEHTQAMGLGATRKGLWVAGGSIVVESTGDFEVRVAVRMLYPPGTGWGHVLFSGTAKGSHSPDVHLSISGAGLLYRSMDELVGMGDLDFTVSAGAAEIGGAHVGFNKDGKAIGFITGAMLFEVGSATGKGTGSFKRD